MSKKSVLTSLLLAGAAVFSGCNQKNEKTASEPKETKVQHVENPKTQEQKIQEFEKAAKAIPIFRDELPHAMILSDGKDGYVQVLYPAKRGDTVVESKEQYEKRIKWLNEKYPVDIPHSLTLRGCKWENYTTPPKMPFVSMFDDKRYIQQHVAFMQKFWEKKGLPSGEKYSVQTDPIALWYVAQELPRQIAAEHKVKAAAISQKRAERH